MKRIFILTIAIMAIMSLALVGCSKKETSSGNSTPSQSSSNNSRGQQLITEDTKTAEGSEARSQYFADTVREEFTFNRNGTLTGFKRIYTFVDGADKERALERITAAEFKATIDGNTLVVDGDGNYLGFPYADSNFDEIKGRMDDRGTKYIVN